MSLTEKLKQQKAKFLEKVPEDTAKTMQRATDDLRNSDILDRTVKPGDKAPDFTLPNESGQLVSLSDLLSQGWLILSFYRGVW